MIEPVGTHAARGLRLSKASRQRYKRACEDLCCSRLRAIEGKLQKAFVGLGDGEIMKLLFIHQNKEIIISW